MKCLKKLLLICLGLALCSMGNPSPVYAEDDITGPELVAVYPIDFTNDSTPEIILQATDDSEILAAEATLAIDQGPPVTGFVYDSATGPFSTQWPIPLTDGSHVASAEVKDINGNSSNLTWTFTVDTSAPVITRGTPEEGSIQRVTTNSFPEYAVYVTDENRVSEAAFFLNGVRQSNAMLMNWGASQLAFLPGSPSFPDGEVAVTLELKDAAGNVTSRQWTVSVEGRPLISSYAPNGVTTTYTPTISAYLRDYSGVDANEMYLSIDGGPEINVASYYNPRTRYLNYPVTTPFSPQKHTVVLRAKCVNGHETTATWSFWYDFDAPTVSSVKLLNYPSQGKILEVTEGMVLNRGKDLDFSFTTSEQLYLFELTLDGVPMQANGSYIYWSRLYNTGWTLNPLTLKDGPHNITVKMTDAGLNNGTYSINFTVQDAPVISDEKPVNLAKIPIPAYNHLNYYSELTDRRFEAVIADQQPQISMKVTDGNDVLTPGQITFKLDGIERPFSYDQVSGALTYRPTEKLEDERVHTVNVTAKDTLNTTNAEWSFYINTYPRMKWTTDKTCLSCHSESARKHFSLDSQILSEYNTDCSKCHGSYVANSMDQRCIACHRDYWHITVYPQGSFHEVAHNDQTGLPGLILDSAHRSDLGTCTPCHAKSINREHAQAGRTDAAGKPITCDTCHLSTSTEVQQAIAARDSNCGSCHSSSAEGHEAMHVSGLDSNCTKECHKGSLIQEHLNNPKTQARTLTCNTCHENQNPIVAAAIVNNRVACAACHYEGHNLLMAIKLDTDFPTYPDLKMTTPIPARIYAGEIPPSFEGGYAVVSGNAAITGNSVYSFYKAELGNLGWNQISANPQDLSSFELVFEKEGRSLMVRFRGTSDSQGRIMLLYN